jgi:RIO-like serine/threonine protein kinase
MEAGKHNIKQLFQKDVRYIIPTFQRPYVWNQEKQWELWDDAISRKSTPTLAEENNHSRKKRARTYHYFATSQRRRRSTAATSSNNA